jgi:hypothetical protein
LICTQCCSIARDACIVQARNQALAKRTRLLTSSALTFVDRRSWPACEKSP